MTNFKPMPDDQLVALYIKGEDNAFDVLLERYKDKLFSYIFSLVHDEDRANDVFQDTFVKAIITLRQGGYKESGRFYGWLTRIAHNLVQDSYRNQQQQNPISDEEMDGTLFNNVELVTNSIERTILDDQLLEDVQELMKRLPAEQHRVLFMRIYQDMSFKEIAEETGVGLNTALGRMHYAVQNLRRMANEAQIFID